MMTTSNTKLPSFLLNQNASPKNIFVFTGGDPAGIAPEIIEKMFQSKLSTIKRTQETVLIYFSTDIDKHAQKIESICQEKEIVFTKYEIQTRENFFLDLESSSICPTGFLFCDITKWASATKEEKKLFRRVYRMPAEDEKNTAKSSSLSKENSSGRPNEGSGNFAFRSLQIACDFVMRYGCNGMLTAPISKEWVIRSGQKNFCGHTGYLSRYFQQPTIMLMHGRDWSVIPLTEHIPLQKVPSRLKQKIRNPSLIHLLKKVKNLPEYDFPWALCALNPHAGENGLIGKEEKDFLKSWVKQLNQEGLFVEGPISADALFVERNLKKYRLVLSCYHDQGLIPFKSLQGEDGVNCTIGLPFLRTSPDHGPSFDIAGENRADSTSMERAFHLLCNQDWK